MTFVTPYSRIVRIPGRRTVHVSAGISWTIVEGDTEYIDPASREMSRGLVERLYPTIPLPQAGPQDPDPDEGEIEEDLNDGLE